MSFRAPTWLELRAQGNMNYRGKTTVHTRRSDVVYLSIKPRRHVGGIVATDTVKTLSLLRQYDTVRPFGLVNSSTHTKKKICERIGSMHVQFKFTTLHCCCIVYLQHGGDRPKYRRNYRFETVSFTFHFTVQIALGFSITT